MLHLFNFFGEPTPQLGCTLLVQLLLDGFSVDQIHARLLAKKLSDSTASKLVTFLPSAFARIYYQDHSYTFPDHFYPGRDAYSKRQFLFYDKEPVFKAALHLAQQMRRDGDWVDVERIVEISAEYKGIEEAKAKGLTPTGSSLIIYEF